MGPIPRGPPGDLLIKTLVDLGKGPLTPHLEGAAQEPSCLCELPAPSHTALKLSSALTSLLSLVPTPFQMSPGVFSPPSSIPTLPCGPQCPLNPFPEMRNDWHWCGWLLES